MTEDFDVIICGAGPAGCTAAMALGTSGLKVALIEKEESPGEKVCGDAIPAFVPKVLNTIDPLYARAFEEIDGKNKISVCRITAPGKKVIDLKFSGYGFVCRRQIFDSFLFGLASQLPGITVFQGTTINDVSVNHSEAVISTDKHQRLKAQIVIGCDGVSSIVRRKLTGNKISKVESSVAARGYFKNISDCSPDTIELHFLKELLPGYFWIFPLPGNQFNVGLGMLSKKISGNRINLREELLNIIKKEPYLARRFQGTELTGEIKGHLIPLCSAKTQISGERFMLCGDAASLVNPATGGGIGQAMQSGRYAGWQALKCFEKMDFSHDFIKEYDKTVYSKIWKENLRYLKVRDYVLDHHAVLNFIISTGSKNKLIYKTILNILE
jgi:geranylgeranyl reductase family protein